MVWRADHFRVGHLVTVLSANCNYALHHQVDSPAGMAKPFNKYKTALILIYSGRAAASTVEDPRNRSA